MTKEEAEQKVLEDYRAVSGKVILVRDLTAFIGDTCDQRDFCFDPPIAVRVEKRMDIDPRSSGLLRWADKDWIDPYWDIEIVDTDRIDIPPEGLRGCYMFGTSYNIKTGECESTDWTVQKTPSLMKRLWRWLVKGITE